MGTSSRRPSDPRKWLRRGLAAAGCLVVHLAGPGSTAIAGETRFDYLYIVANEDGSSGGHAAVRLGRFVYHFQNEDGLLVLKRDRTEDFFFDYALVENRTIHASRIEVSEQAFAAIVARFRTRHRAQEAQLETARALTRDERLLERLRDRAQLAAARSEPLRLAVPGLGYFDMQPTRPESEAPWLLELRRNLFRRHGADVLVRRRRELMRELDVLAERDPFPATIRPPDSVYDHPAFERSISSRWLDVASGLAAIDVLEQANALDPDSYHAPRDAAFDLDSREIEALRRFARTLEAQLLDLADSRRSDWGRIFLVALARLGTLHRSIETGHLVFLDTFPESTEVDSATVDPGSAEGTRVLEENRREFEASLAYLRDQPQPDELAWERLEERSNRYFEISRALRESGSLRIAKGHLVPSRARDLPIPVSLEGDVQQRSEQWALARARARDYDRRMRQLYRYGLITRNCVTALFDTLNDSFGNSARLSQQQLGGHISGKGSLAFIPFVSASRVNEDYRVVARETIWSYRQARLREMRKTEDSLWLALRESNTFSARSYRRRSADSFFVFFTDETVLWRPVLGAVNLAAGLGESVLGLVTAPVDRGRILTRGLRGTFMSLPELLFWNIRKGSNDWIPPEDRDLKRLVVTSRR
jgi:hypothetical protein